MWGWLPLDWINRTPHTSSRGGEESSKGAACRLCRGRQDTQDAERFNRRLAETQDGRRLTAAVKSCVDTQREVDGPFFVLFFSFSFRASLDTQLHQTAMTETTTTTTTDDTNLDKERRWWTHQGLANKTITARQGKQEREKKTKEIHNIYIYICKYGRIISQFFFVC